MSRFKTWLKQINSKQAIKTFTFVIGLLLVIITTILDVGINKERFSWSKWLSRTMILVGIMVYGLLMGESIGGDKQKENPEGLYQINLNEYELYIKSIEPIVIYFSQFYYKFVQRQIRSKKIDFLKNNGILYDYCECIVDVVKTKDLWQLQKEEGLVVKYKGEDFFIEQQTKEQIEAIKFVVEGNVNIEEPKYNYYLSAFETNKNKYETEEPEELDKQIKVNKIANRSLKIVSSLVISIFWSMLTVNEFMGGGDPSAKAQAWSNLVSRITALFTSFISGWGSSVIDTRLRAKKLKGKTNMLIKFKSAYDTGDFIPMSLQERNKRKHDEVIEENKKKEVNVEVVEPIQIEEKPIIILGNDTTQ